MNRLERNERLIRLALLVVAFSAVSVLAVITVFIFAEGTPIMFKYGFRNFLAGLDWYPTEKSFGLLPMITGSLMVTFGALVIGVPLGLACAVYPDGVLVPADAADRQAGDRAPGRDPLGGLRLHRRRHPGPVHPGDSRRARVFRSWRPRSSWAS